MKTAEGRKKFLDYAISSGITKEVPIELWLSLAFKTENLLKDTSKKYAAAVAQSKADIETLIESGAIIDMSEFRGYAGNLPFKNTVEARNWIADSIEAEFKKLKAEGLTDAQARKQADALFPKKGSSKFNNLFTKTDVFTNKNNLEIKLNDKAFIKSQDDKINELKEFFKLLQNKVMRDADGNPNFEGIAFVGAMLSSSSAGTKHFLRNAAPMRFYQVGYRQMGPGEVRIEHTMPATLVGKYLFMAAIEGSIDTKFKTIKDNYVQGPLLKVDDKKLKGKKANGESFDYTEQMPDFWQETDSVWARYFNSNVIRNSGGINPATIMFGKGESAFSKFNITASGLLINNETKNQMPKVEALNASSQPLALTDPQASTQQQVYNQGVLDNALNEGRKLDTPVKKFEVKQETLNKLGLSTPQQ
jgi:hypothetical protein